MIDIIKEKAIVASSLNVILNSLQPQFPWIVIEAALSMQDRLGEENSLIMKAFEHVLDDRTKKLLEEYLPECGEEGAVTSDVAAAIMNSYTNAGVASVLAKPVFTVDSEVLDECQPWDIEDTRSAYSFDFLTNTNKEYKLQTIRKVKMDLRSLALTKAKIACQADDFKDEIIAIDTLFEILNFDETSSAV